MKDFTLYHAALEADATFHAALVIAYGERRAPDARYLMSHTDAKVNAAKAAKLRADHLWRVAQREA